MGKIVCDMLTDLSSYSKTFQNSLVVGVCDRSLSCSSLKAGHRPCLDTVRVERRLHFASEQDIMSHLYGEEQEASGEKDTGLHVIVSFKDRII